MKFEDKNIDAFVVSLSISNQIFNKWNNEELKIWCSRLSFANADRTNAH